MAFASRYRYDVFVSYAHADDTPDTSGVGWVSQFVACLEVALRQRLGGTDELRLYFDHSHLHANHVLDDLLAAARDSAVFLAIASRSYAMRDWTKRELDAFVRGADDLHRLFAVECLPLDDGEVYPAPLQDHKRVEFWHVNSPHSQTAMPLSAALDPLQFHRRIHDVADQIRRQLGLLRTASAKVAPPAAHADRTLPAPAGPQRTVLLAQVTEDLEVEREQVRRYLERIRRRDPAVGDISAGWRAVPGGVRVEIWRAPTCSSNCSAGLSAGRRRTSRKDTRGRNSRPLRRTR